MSVFEDLGLATIVNKVSGWSGVDIRLALRCRCLRLALNWGRGGCSRMRRSAATGQLG